MTIVIAFADRKGGRCCLAADDLASGGDRAEKVIRLSRDLFAAVCGTDRYFFALHALAHGDPPMTVRDVQRRLPAVVREAALILEEDLRSKREDERERIGQLVAKHRGHVLVMNTKHLALHILDFEPILPVRDSYEVDAVDTGDDVVFLGNLAPIRERPKRIPSDLDGWLRTQFDGVVQKFTKAGGGPYGELGATVTRGPNGRVTYRRALRTDREVFRMLWGPDKPSKG